MIVLFLVSCGAPQRKWFARLAASTEESETYDAAIVKLKKNLCGNKQLIYLISQMLGLKQKANQVVEDFDMEIEKYCQKIH